MKFTQNPMVVKARDLAERAHRGQKDKSGRDYYEHVVGVAETLINPSPMEYTVALLHDTIEDTNVTHVRLYDMFGSKVASAVEILSRRLGEDYDDYIKRVITDGDNIAIKVKVADLLYNLTHLHRLSEFSRGGLAKRYVRALTMIATRSTEI